MAEGECKAMSLDKDRQRLDLFESVRGFWGEGKGLPYFVSYFKKSCLCSESTVDLRKLTTVSIIFDATLLGFISQKYLLYCISSGYIAKNILSVKLYLYYLIHVVRHTLWS